MPAIMGPRITELPPELLAIIVENTPPDSIVCLGSTCNNLRGFVLGEWERRLRLPQDCVPLGPTGPAFCQRYKRLQEVTLLPDEADELTQDYQMLNLPAVFDDSKLSLAALLKIYDGKGKEGEARLVKALHPRFMRALHLIADPASSPRDYLLGVVVIREITRPCPFITPAVMGTKEGHDAISHALETITLLLNNPERREMGIGRTAGRAFWVDDIKPFVSGLERQHILKHFAAIQVGVMSMMNNLFRYNRGIGLLIAILQRTKRLCMTEDELAPIRRSMLEVIVEPYQRGKSTSLEKLAKAWDFLDTWSQLLGPNDAQLARQAFEIASHSAETMDDSQMPPGLGGTMQRLAEYLPKDHVKDGLRRTGESIVLEVSKGPTDYPEARWSTITKLFGKFKVLCLASDEVGASRACAEIASGLPQGFEWSPKRTASFVARCGHLFPAALARRVWQTRHPRWSRPQTIWGPQGGLESLAPQLDARDAQTAFEEAREFLGTLGTLHWPGGSRQERQADPLPGSAAASASHWMQRDDPDKDIMRPDPVKDRYQHRDGYKTALMELAALANRAAQDPNRVAELAEVVLATLLVIVAGWPEDRAASRAPDPELVDWLEQPIADVKRFGFVREAQLACRILGAMPCISRGAFRDSLHQLHELSIGQRSTDIAFEVLSGIILEALPCWQIDILEFLEKMNVQDLDLVDLQILWTDFVGRTDCDVEAAHRSYTKAAKRIGLSQMMCDYSFWPLAKKFAEKLGRASRDAWVDSVLAVMEMSTADQRKAIYQVPEGQLGNVRWDNPVLTPVTLESFARLTSGTRRERVLRLLQELYDIYLQCCCQESDRVLDEEVQGDALPKDRREWLWANHHLSVREDRSRHFLGILYHLADDATLKSWDARLSSNK